MMIKFISERGRGGNRGGGRGGCAGGACGGPGTGPHGPGNTGL